MAAVNRLEERCSSGIWLHGERDALHDVCSTDFVFLYSIFSFHTDILSSCHECQSHSKYPLPWPRFGSATHDTRVQCPTPHPRRLHSLWGLKFDLGAVLKPGTRLNNYSYDHPCSKTTERLWNHRPWGWRDGAAVKNTYLRPLFSSQHPHGSSQPSATPLRVALTLSSGLCVNKALMWRTYMKASQTGIHIKKFFLKNYLKNSLKSPFICLTSYTNPGPDTVAHIPEEQTISKY